MHTLDHQSYFADRLSVIAYANHIRLVQSLVWNCFGEAVLVVERDFERRDPIVFPPRIFVLVVIISSSNQYAIERQRPFDVERNALANPIAFDSFGPGRLYLPLRIGPLC